MILKDLLKLDFGVDLPISGGFGNSVDNAIIIHRTDLNDYVQTEYFILNCLGKGRCIEWKGVGQELLFHNHRKIDKIKIETIETTRNEIITQIENYYFDITECFIPRTENQIEFDEKLTLEKIKKRIEKLRKEDKFNKMCIDRLKEGKLFNDSKLTAQFLDVILVDESLPLFELMMKYKGKPILDVLRIVGPQLTKTKLSLILKIFKFSR